MSRGKIILIVVAAVIVAILGYRLFAGGSKTAGPGRMGGGDNAPVPVTVVKIEQKNVPIYQFAQGTVQAVNSVAVRPQIGGLLMKLHFQEGQRVEQGTVIAEIDPRTFQAQYDQAVARQKQDQAQLATARSNLKRSQDLIKKNYISQQDLTALQNTVNQYEAAVTADAASVRDAKVQLDYAQVRAPISGLAGIRQVDPGNVLGTGDVIVTITQMQPINVLFDLPADSLDTVRSAQARATLPVTALDSSDQHVLAGDGVLKVIDNQINTASGTYRLKAEFPNTARELWPGQYVSTRLQTGTVENGLVAPTEAVQRGPNGDYVYLLNPADNTVSMQPVTTTGQVDATHVLLGSGLKAGDQVVTEGMFRLKPGSKVSPMAPGEAPKQPSAADLAKATKQAASGGGRHH
ncbi:MAG TPA: efflux RND transporter periplasmic adaptor subunit [Rhodanobacteraceae bacterium]|nr:efflux RND transporter periplasmic adaptor subunit [Rhodanobacteraceae bacterium]